MSKFVILLSGFRSPQISGLCDLFPEVEFRPFEEDGLPEGHADALVSLTQDALDAVFRPEVLDRCPGLRWVHASSAGIDDYLPYLSDVSFTLTCGKILQGPAVADHAMTLLLALTRRLPWILRGKRPAEMPRPTELRGKKALVIGYGGIGMGIAERAAAFGMRVNCVTEINMPLVSFVDHVYFAHEFLEAVPEADVVLVAAPLTKISRAMLDREALSRMKQTAYLINVSRGPIIDTDALVEELRRGRFEGVGLDVTDPEPLPDHHPLRQFDRVLITPHYAGTTTTLQRRFELIETNLRRFIDGRPLINVVDKKLGF